MFICSVRKYGTRQQIFVTVFVVITIWKENSASDLFSFRYAAATKNFSWHLSFIIWFLVTGCSNEKNNFVQVNLCQKLFFLHQLTHTMTTDCSLNYKFNTWKFLAQNMGRTCCVQKLFLTFRTISVYKMFSPCSAKRRASDKDLPVWFSKDFGGKFKLNFTFLNFRWVHQKFLLIAPSDKFGQEQKCTHAFV